LQQSIIAKKRQKITSRACFGLQPKYSRACFDLQSKYSVKVVFNERSSTTLSKRYKVYLFENQGIIAFH
jgi:hypothetical protein